MDGLIEGEGPEELVLLLRISFLRFENEVLASDALVDVEDVETGGFEVGGGIVGGGDEDLVLGAVGNGLVGVHHTHELLGDGT